MKDGKFIDVPVRKRWAKRWFTRSVKLALVVGFLGLGYDAWTRFSRYEENRATMLKSEIGYRCAAALSDDTLSNGLKNGYTIDISSLGCTSTPFFVSMQEVWDMRAGKLTFEPYGTPFEWQSSILAAAAWAILSMMVTTSFIAAVAIARWVWL